MMRRLCLTVGAPCDNGLCDDALRVDGGPLPAVHAAGAPRQNGRQHRREARKAGCDEERGPASESVKARFCQSDT